MIEGRGKGATAPRVPGAKRIAPGALKRGDVGARRALLVGRILVVTISVAMLGVLARVGQLQLRPSPGITRLINSQRSGEDLPARRGSLLDRHGRVIAATRTAQRLFVDPLLIDDLNTFPENLGYQLDYDPAWVAQRLDGSRSQRYVVIDQQLGDARVARLEGFRLSGLSTELRLVRDYPQHTLAGQVIGFVGVDGQGLEGLELKFDSRLRGVDGAMRYWRDASQQPLWVQQEGYHPPVDGRAVTLSLDLVIQSFVDDELAKTCQEYGAESGQIVVMDPLTGEILAMASWPFYDPQDAGATSAEVRRNRCVTDVFEPGSTFKPFVWAAATEAGVARPGEQIDCHMGYYVSPQGRRLHDAHGYGLLSWEFVLVKSSNIGMAIVGQRLGARRMHEAVGRFGFGAIPGSGLPGEIAGLVNPLDKWTHYSVTSVPMGQEIAVTPLQLIRGFAVLANGGVLVTPTIHRVDPLRAGGEPQINERIISQATADLTRRVLRSVVTDGTGRRLKDSAYEIFGKTGTAQVPGPGGYLPDQYTAVFLGGAPFDQPRIVVACVIHRPDKSKGYYGGIVAAPAAMGVIERTLTYMGVAPREAPTDLGPARLARR